MRSSSSRCNQARLRFMLRILAVRAGETPARWAARCCGASSEDLPVDTSLPAPFGSSIARAGEPALAWLSSGGTPGCGGHRAHIARMRASASALPGPGLELPPTRGHARLVSGDRSRLEPGFTRSTSARASHSPSAASGRKSRSSPFRPRGWACARLRGGASSGSPPPVARGGRLGLAARVPGARGGG